MDKDRGSVAAGLVALVAVAAVFAAGVAVFVLAVSGVKHAVHATEARYSKDVAIHRCGVNALGQAQADLEVTNHSSGLSDYLVKVAFYTPSGVNLADGEGAVEQVPAGMTRAGYAFSPGTASEVGLLSCKVTDVLRTASS